MRKEYRNFLRRSHWLPDWIRGSFSDLGKPIRLPASGGHSSSSGSDQGPVSPSTATTSNSVRIQFSKINDFLLGTPDSNCFRVEVGGRGVEGGSGSRADGNKDKKV